MSIIAVALSDQNNNSPYLKVFFIVFLIVIGCFLGKAFVTGSVQIRGEKEPRRRKDKPREFREAMGILTVIYIIIAIGFVWLAFIAK